MKNITWIILLITSFSFAQNFDAKSLSMAGNTSAFVRGIDAVSWNPANLANARGNMVELNLLSFSTGLYNSSFSLRNYNKYFTKEGNGGYWSVKDKNEILDLIPDDGFSMRLDHNLNLLGFACNNFAFALQLEAMGKARINAKKPVEIALFGESVDTSYTYNENNVMGGDFYAAVKMTLGYAYPFEAEDLFDLDDKIPGLEEVAVGLNFNYYMGVAVGQVERSSLNARRVTSEILEYDVNLQARAASLEGGFPSGNGFGFDLGLNALYKKDWRFSLVLRNIIGGISWNGNPERVMLIERDYTNVYEEDDVDYSFSEDTTMSINSFNTPLPKTMMIGAAYAFRSDLTFTADWHQGFDSHFGNTTTPRLGVGTQYLPLEWLALRGGMSVGGKEGFLMGLGAGAQLPWFQFDISYALHKALFPTYARGILLATSIKFMF
jgi:hypothetical protein